MLARTDERPLFEEREITPPKRSDLIYRRVEVVRDGRRFIEVTATPKPGRAIFCVVRIIPADGSEERYQIGTRKTRGRPPGHKPKRAKQNGPSTKAQDEGSQHE